MELTLEERPAAKPAEDAKPEAPAAAPKPAAPAATPAPKAPEAEKKPVTAALTAKIAEAEKLAAAAAKVKAADLAAAPKAPEAPKAAPAPAAKPDEAVPATPAPAEARPVIPAALMQNAKALGNAKTVAAPAPAAAAAENKGGILFLDDDPRILNSLRALFRSHYDVHIAESGEAAIEILRKGGIQVVVSDQRMPNMTGVDFLRQVRALAPNAVRMLLTGYTDLASLVGSINQGEIFRFVMKPWDNDELKKSVADAFKLAAELAATEPAKPTPATRNVGSLLVIDESDGVAKGLERLLAGAAKVIRVDNAPEAAQVLSKVEIAALVADLGVGTDALVALFREIRAKLPGVLCIVLTEEPDSDLSIELINKAQIFRLLPKPVNARDLRTQVAEALRRYSIYKQRVAAGALKPPAQAAAAAAKPAAPATPGRASQPD
jgi:response regulator RpfG family c-di-GMP phosphodiesterase